jgi:hypothetical protein
MWSASTSSRCPESADGQGQGGSRAAPHPARPQHHVPSCAGPPLCWACSRAWPTWAARGCCCACAWTTRWRRARCTAAARSSASWVRRPGALQQGLLRQWPIQLKDARWPGDLHMELVHLQGGQHTEAFDLIWRRLSAPSLVRVLVACALVCDGKPRLSSGRGWRLARKPRMHAQASASSRGPTTSRSTAARQSASAGACSSRARWAGSSWACRRWARWPSSPSRAPAGALQTW